MFREIHRVFRADSGAVVVTRADQMLARFDGHAARIWRSNGQPCADCVQFRPNVSWSRWVSDVLRHHQIIVPDRIRPLWIGPAVTTAEPKDSPCPAPTPIVVHPAASIPIWKPRSTPKPL